jgi:RecA-family ATPase
MDNQPIVPITSQTHKEEMESDIKWVASEAKKKGKPVTVALVDARKENARFLASCGESLSEQELTIYVHGVYGTNNNWREVFHTKTEALALPENVQIVIRGLCNVGNMCIWGGLPKHGKSYLFLSLIKALLSGKNWLDYFEVSQSKRVIYLVPEVGLRGVVKRLRKLKMLDYLYDPATNPDGKLFVQSLSSLQKLALDDTRLLEAVKDADVFVDPLIRFIDGDENNSGEQRILSNKLLRLLGCEARSVWVAHHSPKAFKDVRDITTQNVLRGTSEFAAFPDIIFGVLKINDETARLYIKCTDARDDDEYLGDFEVELRPWIDEEGDMRLVVQPGKGTPLNEQRKSGKKADPDKQQKIDYARSVEGSTQEKADAVNEKFGSKHHKSTIHQWLKPFDTDKFVA